jgi:hypothetical protein
MADNFNLRTFLSENKLTKNAQLLKEGSDYGYEALMDVVDTEYDGDPTIAAAVEDAYHNGDIDTSDFGHDPSAPSNAVAQIIDEIGLYEEEVPENPEDYTKQPGYVHETLTAKERHLVETMTKADLLAKGEYKTPQGETYEILKSDPHTGGWAGKHAPNENSVWVQKKGTKASDTHRGHYVDYQRILKDLEKTKDTVKENTLTAKERRLVEMVQTAMREDNGYATHDGSFGGDDSEENVDYTMGRKNDPNQLPNPAPELTIPEGEDMVEEKPLPKYENIEKLMQEIEKSTDEAAHKYKMQEMKRVADGLEKKATALEEGDNAEHIDQKKLKQMKKDIMSLRKGIEKMEKLGEKKFTKKETKDSKPAESLSEGNFDLRKFLAENRK